MSHKGTVRAHRPCRSLIHCSRNADYAEGLANEAGKATWASIKDLFGVTTPNVKNRTLVFGVWGAANDGNKPSTISPAPARRSICCAQPACAIQP